MTDVIIREMERKELKRIIKIQQKELYPELEDWQIKQWTEGEGIFAPKSFVVLRDEKIIGFIIFEIYEVKRVENINEIIISLDSIAISEDFQKEGIGKKLLKEGLEKAMNYWDGKGFKVKGLIVETGTEEATGFYEKVFSSFEKRIFPNIWSDEEGIVHFFIYL